MTTPPLREAVTSYEVVTDLRKGANVVQCFRECGSSCRVSMEADESRMLMYGEVDRYRMGASPGLSQHFA